MSRTRNSSGPRHHHHLERGAYRENRRRRIIDSRPLGREPGPICKGAQDYFLRYYRHSMYEWAEEHGTPPVWLGAALFGAGEREIETALIDVGRYGDAYA